MLGVGREAKPYRMKWLECVCWWGRVRSTHTQELMKKCKCVYHEREVRAKIRKGLLCPRASPDLIHSRLGRYSSLLALLLFDIQLSRDQSAHYWCLLLQRRGERWGMTDISVGPAATWLSSLSISSSSSSSKPQVPLLSLCASASLHGWQHPHCSRNNLCHFPNCFQQRFSSIIFGENELLRILSKICLFQLISPCWCVTALWCDRLLHFCITRSCLLHQNSQFSFHLLTCKEWFLHIGFNWSIIKILIATI